MRRIPSWLIYTVFRLLLVFVPFGLMLALGVDWLLAILLATIIAFALSLVLLRNPREATARSLSVARERRLRREPSADEQREDAQVADAESAGLDDR